MELEDVLHALERYRGYFPREALLWAIEERDRITPHLLQILSHAAENSQGLIEDQDYSAHIYAMFLLSQFREKSAYPLFVKFFSQPGDLAIDSTGDIVTEDLDSMLASVSCGDDGPIKAMIENEDLNEWVRGAALRSLVILVAAGEKTRESVVEYFGSLFREKLSRKPSNVWVSLPACAIDLYPEELYEDIKQSFEDDLVDEFFLGFSAADLAMDDGKERTLDLLNRNPAYRIITDTIAEMEWWPCFRPEAIRTPKQKPKIGRNQPCPCGSGKKYKKCCGLSS
jgi:hypothetical protein